VHHDRQGGAIAHAPLALALLERLEPLDLVESNEISSMTGTVSRRPLVLLVDDYPDAREMYGEYLETSGFGVVEAANGLEALQRAVDARPDIILMDLSLPVMDGWEVTRRLKADLRTAAIPVVGLTGQAHSGSSESARAAGCDGFVIKPCLPDDLVREIRKVLDRSPRAASTLPAPRL
jgi:CheY-like chemotaxis protein